MRLLGIVAGLIVGLLVQAVPALAHTHAHVVAALPAAKPASAAAAKPAAPEPGICEIDLARLEAFITQGTVPGDDMGAHGPDQADHDPADHSHPFGEDSDHQLMSHGGFDMAAHADQPAAVAEESVAQSCATGRSVPLSGFLIPPPVRPPLG
jgi:hypothetical protein